jgi:HK97 family phage major capsid protein
VKPDLKANLTNVRDEISGLRDQRSDLRRRREKAIQEATGSDGRIDTDSPAYERAASLHEQAQGVEDDLADRLLSEQKLLDMMGPTGGRGSTGTSVDPEAAALMAEPGRWLSAVLSRRAGDVPQLSDEVKQRAAMMAGEAPESLTTTSYNSAAESTAAINLLAPQSVAMASGIARIDIETTKTRLPRFTQLPEAGWIGEGKPFPKSAPGLKMEEVEPPKVGLVTPISIEVFDDLNPAALQLVEMNVMRATALAYDAGILFGSGTGEEPAGIASTVGVLAQKGKLNGFGVFRKALAELLGKNARPGAMAINPKDFGKLLDLVEFEAAAEGGSTSKVPLIKGPSLANGFTIDALPGIRWFLTPAAPEGKAVMYDPSVIAAVVRKQAEIAIDPYFDFENGEVGLRVYLRGDVLVGQVDGVCVLTFEA